jgi:HK97 family phage major capsid protein
MQKRLIEINAELAKIEARAAEINVAVETADESVLDTLNSELSESEDRAKALKHEREELEQKENDARSIENGTDNGTDVEIPHTEEKRMPIKRNDPEYRDAFLANLMGNATAEQRDALITTDNGIVLPESIETKIWDLIHDAHPVLNDITMFNTGTVLVINQHTAITAGKTKKTAQGVANDIETNTFVKVTLTGNDYAKSVELSYAEAKMTQGALEQYLTTEIAADMGEVMALDIFAQMKSDIGAAAVTVASGTSLTYKNLLTAFGAAKHATALTIYASSANAYGEIYGMVDTNGQPVIRDGIALGATVKIDAAAGDDIFVVEPANYEANMVQPIMIETTRDIEKHKIIYSGYARMQGCMRDTACGAYIAKATA